QVAADVLAECRRVGIPLVLEPLFFGLADPADRPGVVIETTRRFAALGPDLLKLPFPVDVDHDTDPASWHSWCAQITDLCSMPWALLSGGGTFESFAAQVEAAVDAGCSGFLVGRALWGEAVLAPAEQRTHLIATQVIPRFEHLRSIVDR
ncbi:MAG: hypothetical protein GY708_10320, partial [Actinomycetia bacterium]|nr:hypothetical protein [Actinomycetes bacterium]